MFNVPRDRRLYLIFTTLFLFGGMSIGHALASGYGLRESVSASAFANAHAGATSAAEDISYMFFNPAGLTRQSGTQVMFGAQWVMPDGRFRGGSASNVITVPIPGNQAGQDIGEDAIVPSFYGMWDVGPDTRLGLGLTVPWGLSTDHPDGWIGRYHALESKVIGFNVNPAIAHRVSPGLSIGGGLQFQYAKATLSNAIDFGTLVFGVPDPAEDGHAKFSGDDWGVGFNLGILWEPRSDTRLGIAYRSAVSHKLSGDTRFSLSNLGAAAFGGTGLFVNTGSQAAVTTPETYSAGITHDVNPQWSVMAEVAWTKWSRFQELRIIFDGAQPDDVTVAQWDNTIFAALGAAYRPNENWTFRIGAAFDESPVPGSTRNPRLPDQDRYWLAIGAGYRAASGIRVDFGYTHFIMKDADINLSSNQPGNAFRGNLDGSFRVSSDLLTLQMTVPF